MLHVSHAHTQTQRRTGCYGGKLLNEETPPHEPCPCMCDRLPMSSPPAAVRPRQIELRHMTPARLSQFFSCGRDVEFVARGHRLPPLQLEPWCTQGHELGTVPGYDIGRQLLSGWPAHGSRTLRWPGYILPHHGPSVLHPGEARAHFVSRLCNA